MLAKSKLSPTEAEEFTNSLGQITVGNYGLMESAMYVLNVPEALGLTNEEWVEQRLGGYIKWSVESRRDAVKELLAAGKKQIEIAEILGISKDTVMRDKAVLEAARAALEAGKASEKAARAASLPKLKTAERDEHIRRLIEKGLTDAEIVVEFQQGIEWDDIEWRPMDVGVPTVGKVRTAITKEREKEKVDQAAARKSEHTPSKAERKAAEAEFGEFVDETKKAHTEAYGISPVPSLVDADEELRQVMDAGADFKEFGKAVSLWSEIGRNLWIYGARRGLDVSAITRAFEDLKGEAEGR